MKLQNCPYTVNLPKYACRSTVTGIQPTATGSSERKVQATLSPMVAVVTFHARQRHRNPARKPRILKWPIGAKQHLRRQWMVGNSRGDGGEQNQSGGVTENRQNRSQSRRRFRETLRLRSVAFRTFSGGKDDMQITSGSRASDRY